MNRPELHDVVIVGGGPAGLSAALLLGRCMRRVVLIDSSETEIGSVPSSCVCPGHDGCSPSEFLHAGREQLRRFETVTYANATVENVKRNGFGYTAYCDDGTMFTAKALVLASDYIARTPPIPDAERFYGSSLLQCPYCDGWEHRGRQIGVLGADEAAAALAVKLLQWSARVTLFTNGDALDESGERLLTAGRVKVVRGAVASLAGQDGQLELVRIDDTSSHPCDALFYISPREYHTGLAARLGCDLQRIRGANTGIEGLFVAGSSSNASEMTVVAASEGLTAAEAVNDWLLAADRSYFAMQSTSSVPRNARPLAFSRR